MKKWRFLDTGFSDCYTNMAIDEAMLIEYEGDGSRYQGLDKEDLSPKKLPTLRIYGWRPKAFSLGYFQDPAQELDLAKCKNHNIPFVRRMTGGGLIFHHQELTYSLVCSRDDISTFASVKEGFKIICSFLMNTYKALGPNAEFSMAETPKQKKSWFCFAAREKYDILINGKKIGGNAQRRRKNIIFQHGSIPLKSNIDEAVSFLKERPKDIKDTCSLEEVLRREISFSELKDAITKSFEETFSVTLLKEDLTYREEELARQLVTEKYKTKDWNLFKNADINQKAGVA